MDKYESNSKKFLEGFQKYISQSGNPSLESILKKEEDESIKTSILSVLAYRSPECPCNLATEIGLNERSIYYYLSELLANNYIHISTYNENYNEEARKTMIRIREIEIECHSIRVNDKSHELLKKTNIWFDYFKELENQDLTISLLCSITNKGKEHITELV